MGSHRQQGVGPSSHPIKLFRAKAKKPKQKLIIKADPKMISSKRHGNCQNEYKPGKMTKFDEIGQPLINKSAPPQP